MKNRGGFVPVVNGDVRHEGYSFIKRSHVKTGANTPAVCDKSVISGSYL